jgi:uncharacterized protein YecE (DUF72 family)
VELDASRALPTAAVARLWAAGTPGDFVFDVRAHRVLTGHEVEPRRLPRRVRDLLPPSLAGANRVMGDEVPPRVRDAAWADLLGALGPLAAGGQLGAVLLPLPRWLAPGRAGADLLAAARDMLGGRPAAVEFRHPDWLAAPLRRRTLALLERLGLAHVVVHAPDGRADTPPRVAAVTHARLAVVRVRPGGAAGAVGADAVAASVAALAGEAAAVHVVVGRGGGDGVGEAAALAHALRSDPAPVSGAARRRPPAGARTA